MNSRTMSPKIRDRLNTDIISEDLQFHEILGSGETWPKQIHTHEASDPPLKSCTEQKLLGLRPPVVAKTVFELQVSRTGWFQKCVSPTNLCINLGIIGGHVGPLLNMFNRSYVKFACQGL